MNRNRSIAILITFLTGCGGNVSPPQRPSVAKNETPTPADIKTEIPKPDPRARMAAIRVLFVGNSHTHYHGLPHLVGQMLEHLAPGQGVFVDSVMVGFLEDLKGNAGASEKLSAVRWTHVVLQAQKISASGKYRYSQEAGLHFAQQAVTSGARVYFFSEWGIQGHSENTDHTESIYDEMARQSKGTLIPVGSVWRDVLKRSPNVPLYEADGNHETQVGAFLTACSIAKALAEKPIPSLVRFRPTEVSESLANLFVESADQRIPLPK